MLNIARFVLVVLCIGLVYCFIGMGFSIWDVAETHGNFNNHNPLTTNYSEVVLNNGEKVVYSDKVSYSDGCVLWVNGYWEWKRYAYKVYWLFSNTEIGDWVYVDRILVSPNGKYLINKYQEAK